MAHGVEAIGQSLLQRAASAGIIVAPVYTEILLNWTNALLSLGPTSLISGCCATISGVYAYCDVSF